MKNVFSQTDSQELINRIEKLTPTSQPLWGKMSVGQMLAHCNVTYEMVYDHKHKKPNPLMRFMLKMFVKDTVVNDKPYKKNSQTAPVFLIKEDKNFEAEKSRLIQYINRVQQEGEQAFEGRESLSFGNLNKQQWNNMFYKHLDHHLQQFGV